MARNVSAKQMQPTRLYQCHVISLAGKTPAVQPSLQSSSNGDIPSVIQTWKSCVAVEGLIPLNCSCLGTGFISLTEPIL